MNCNTCRFLVLKSCFRGPMCFKGIDIKTVKDCSSYQKNDFTYGGLKPDLVIIDDPLCFDYGKIEERVMAEVASKPLTPTLSKNGHIHILRGKNYEQG